MYAFKLWFYIFVIRYSHFLHFSFKNHHRDYSRCKRKIGFCVIFSVGNIKNNKRPCFSSGCTTSSLLFILQEVL